MMTELEHPGTLHSTRGFRRPLPGSRMICLGMLVRLMVPTPISVVGKWPGAETSPLVQPWSLSSALSRYFAELEVC